MSLSLIFLAKGALVLWKAHGTHLALIKGGAYLYHTYGLGTTVAAAKTVAVCAGCYATVSSTVNNSVEGFSLLKDGILENSPSKILAGFLNISNIDLDLTKYLLDGVKEIDLKNKEKSVEQTIENVSILEEIIKERYSTNKIYNVHIDNLYAMSFRDYSLCYRDLLGCAGKCYDSIRKYNASLGKGPS